MLKKGLRTDIITENDLKHIPENRGCKNASVLQVQKPQFCPHFNKAFFSSDFCMGVDIISTPAGNRDRPFGKRSVLRGFLTWGLPSQSPSCEGYYDPVWCLLPVRLPVMGVPVPLFCILLNLRGGVGEDIESPVRPLILCPYPELAEHVRRKGKSDGVPRHHPEISVR